MEHSTQLSIPFSTQTHQSFKILVSVSGIANVPLYCNNNIDINSDKYVIKAILEQSKGNNEETQTQKHNL